MKVIDKDKPLPKHTNLDYYESYAKVVLEEMFPNQFADLAIIDKPDLQNKNLDIGIEVTSSKNPKQQEAEALYVKWSYEDNENKKKIERQIEKCGARLNNGILSGIPGHVNFNRIYYEIKNKTEKLGKYKTFGKQYLFIFSDLYATSDMREKALEEMKLIQNLSSHKFDEIYILVPGAIYVFDFKNSITFERIIDSNMQYLQAYRAREMVTQGEKLAE
ncbi:MAG: hypothetical protein WBI07_03765 [Mobilitalea sp.]